MGWLDSINQLSLFDKALFVQQHGKLIEIYKEDTIKYMLYFIAGYKAELVYNIICSQIEAVFVKKSLANL